MPNRGYEDSILLGLLKRKEDFSEIDAYIQQHFLNNVNAQVYQDIEGYDGVQHKSILAWIIFFENYPLLMHMLNKHVTDDSMIEGLLFNSKQLQGLCFSAVQAQQWDFLECLIDKAPLDQLNQKVFFETVAEHLDEIPSQYAQFIPSLQNAFYRAGQHVL